uniref:Uncharacterized protein n=1 Tax=Glossina brevipalpis TaxID=37001 RepID=A0A1A9X539_9MUSC
MIVIVVVFVLSICVLCITTPAHISLSHHTTPYLIPCYTKQQHFTPNIVNFNILSNSFRVLLLLLLTYRVIFKELDKNRKIGKRQVHALKFPNNQLLRQILIAFERVLKVPKCICLYEKLVFERSMRELTRSPDIITKRRKWDEPVQRPTRPTRRYLFKSCILASLLLLHYNNIYITCRRKNAINSFNASTTSESLLNLISFLILMQLRLSNFRNPFPIAIAQLRLKT